MELLLTKHVVQQFQTESTVLPDLFPPVSTKLRKIPIFSHLHTVEVQIIFEDASVARPPSSLRVLSPTQQPPKKKAAEAATVTGLSPEDEESIASCVWNSRVAIPSRWCRAGGPHSGPAIALPKAWRQSLSFKRFGLNWQQVTSSKSSQLLKDEETQKSESSLENPSLCQCICSFGNSFETATHGALNTQPNLLFSISTCSLYCLLK